MKMLLKKINYILGVCLLAFTFAGCGNNNASYTLSDGEYKVNISMEGGTGKAGITSPASLKVENGKMQVTLVWTSKNYDYMIVDEVTYYNENTGGESTFTIPLESLDEPLEVIADTTAMSVPHEIEYTLSFELEEALGEKTGSVELKYATKFTIDEYGEYKLITIADGGRFLLIPEELDVPKKLDEDIVVLKMPLDKTYLVSSSVMDFICKLDALDNISLSAIKEGDWYIDEAKESMQKGQINYAGKYSAPDYELISSSGCNFAIENTMILHKPEAKEKLEELGIPVLVEYSSYEEHPLGKLEWIKLYGCLYGKEEEANDYFEEELSKIESLELDAKTGKSVAFFYITSNGLVNVRKPKDYISKMIELAGGEYALDNMLSDEDNALSTMNISFEDFYAEAKDADIIIYNSTVDGELGSIEDLIMKNELFRDFKAVQEKEVYCTSKNFFQETTGISDFILDLYKIFTDEKANLKYLKKAE